ncbi:MAG: hypothetical protein K2Q18_12150, partial [Bdellovibrionales bacterium]|nr:hypothetical protein [Bdellovibrionales bacterium]
MGKSTYKAYLLLGAVALSSSCSLMIPDRSYIEQMEREEDGFFAPGADFPVVSGDTGETRRSREEIRERTPASARQSRYSAEATSLSEELLQ